MRFYRLNNRILIFEFLAVFTIMMSAVHAAEVGLTFETTILEITIPPGTNETEISFPFQNNAEKIIAIERINTPCSCLNTQFKDKKMTYQSGEKGQLNATLTIGNLSGTVEKEVFVWLQGDAIDKPSHKLTVKITIPELITVEPKSLQWNVGEAISSKSCKISINQNDPLKITDVTTSNPNFEIKFEVVKEGQEYQFTVTPKNTEKSCFGVVQITSDSKIANYSTISAYALVKSK